MEEAFTNATLNGLTELQQLGLAGVFLSFIFILGGLGLWYFARHCEKRSDANLEAYKEEVAQTRNVVEKNTEAFNGVQIALARMEARRDN